MKMPIYGRKTSTMSRRSQPEIWREFDSEDSDVTRLVGEEEQLMRMGGHARTLTRSSSRAQYIDPWDLENYIYIRSKHSAASSASPERITATPSPAGEPVNSKFYYVPVSDDCPSCCVAGMEEQLFCNDIISGDDMLPEEVLYNSYTDLETSSVEHNSSSCNSSMSALQLHTPGFGSTSGFRRPLVLPKPIPQLEFPAPPPTYEYFETPAASEPNYYSLNDCYECRNGLLIDQQMPDNVPLYATNRHRHNHRRKKHSEMCVPGGRMAPGHFGLSKKGLLQIDYSCNWNNLDKYIAITK